MSMTDPVGDLLTRIRNAHLAKHDRLDVPTSKLKVEVCRILKEQGYITDYSLEERSPRGVVRIILNYDKQGTPGIQHIQRVSRPGRRVYRNADSIPAVRNGLGIGIVSTSKGLLSDSEARAQRVGGELLCEVW